MARRSRKKAHDQRKFRIAVLALVCFGAILLLRRWDLGHSKQPYIRDETEALARVIRSEIGIGTHKQKLHVAWAVRNLAAERQQSVADLACSPCGPQERGRPVASLQRALDSDRKIARRVLAAHSSSDPTGGATHFINPSLQDRLARSGKLPGYRGNTYKRVRRRWMREYGWEPYYRLGPSLELWGEKRRRPGKRRRGSG